MATPDSSKNTSRIILVIVGILVLSALAYFGIKYFTEKAENEQNIAQIADLEQEILELEEQNLDFQNTIQNQDMDVASLRQELAQKQDQIEKYIKQLASAKRQGTADKNLVAQLTARAEKLQGFVNQYEKQIAELEEDKAVLTAQVDTLRTNENRLKQEKQTLTEEKEDTEQKLDETIKIASVLKAREFTFSQIARKGKEKLGTEFRRGALKEVKVCFKLQENLIAEAGEREIYMVLENPDGSVNTNFGDTYSGKFTIEDREKEYSAKSSVNYNRLEQEVCVPYKIAEDTKFVKGPQYVSIYCQGNLIGQAAFNVK